MANTNYHFQSQYPASKRQQTSDADRQAFGSTNSSLYYGMPNATAAGNEYATSYGTQPYSQQRQHPNSQNWDWYTQIGRPSAGQDEAGLAGSNTHVGHPSSTRSASTSLYDTTNLGSLAYASTLDPGANQTQTPTQQLSQRTFAADNYMINRGGVVNTAVRGHPQEGSLSGPARSNAPLQNIVDTNSVDKAEQRYSPVATQPYRSSLYGGSSVGTTYAQNATQQRTPMNTAVQRSTVIQASTAPNTTARESILEKYAQPFSSGQEQTYDSRISSNLTVDGKRSPVQQIPMKRKHVDTPSTGSNAQQQAGYHATPVNVGSGSPASQISSYATPVRTTHREQSMTARFQKETQSDPQLIPANQTTNAQVSSLDSERRDARTYLPHVYNRYPEGAAQNPQRASSPPRPTTVDPSHVYDRYHEYQRQIEAAYAEQARLAAVKAAEDAATAETKAAADAAAADAQAAEAQAAEAAQQQALSLRLQEETARRALAAQTLTKDVLNTARASVPRQDVGVTSSANENMTEASVTGEEDVSSGGANTDPVVEAMEAEMRAMVEKMREYQSRDPKLFVHVWESVKKGQNAKPGTSPAATALRTFNSPTFATRPPVSDQSSKSTNDTLTTSQKDLANNAVTPSEETSGKRRRTPSDAVITKRAAKKTDQAAEKAAAKEVARLQRVAGSGSVTAFRALPGPVNTHEQNSARATTTSTYPSPVAVQGTQQLSSPAIPQRSSNVQQNRIDPSSSRANTTLSLNETPVSASPQVGNEPLPTRNVQGVPEQSSHDSRVSASYPAGLIRDSAVEVPRRETPILPPARPKSYAPKAEVIWPVQYREPLANTAASVLNSLPENAGKHILPKQIREMLDKNPSYTQLCDMIDETGFRMNRGRFAKTLLAIIPASKSMPTGSSVPVSAPVGAVLVPAVTSVLPVSNIARRHDELNKDLSIRGDRGRSTDATPRRGRGRPRKDGQPPIQRKALRMSDGNQISIDPTLEEGGEVLDRIDFISFSSANAISEANKTLKTIKPFRCTMLKAGTDRSCNMAFTLQKGLTRHQETLHADGPSVLCSLCSPPKHFGRLDALYRHNRNLHSERSVDSSNTAVTATGAVQPQTIQHASTTYSSPYNSRLDDSPAAAVAHLQTSLPQTSRAEKHRKPASSPHEELGSRAVEMSRSTGPEQASSSQQSITRTKELAARKKTLAEIIKLTSDTVFDSIETDAPLAPTDQSTRPEPVGVTENRAKDLVRAASTAPLAQTLAGSPSPIKNTIADTIHNNKTNTKESGVALPDSHDESALHLRTDHPLFEDKNIVQPINKSSALRKSSYNAKTIARDVLLSTSKHPEHRGLNAHLQGLITSFQSVDTNSDLASFKWDLVDPGGPLTGSATRLAPLTDSPSSRQSAKSGHPRHGMLESDITWSTMNNNPGQDQHSSMISPAAPGWRMHRNPHLQQYTPASPSGLRNENHTFVIEDDDEDMAEQVYDSTDYTDSGNPTTRPVVEITLKSPKTLFPQSAQTKFPIRAAPVGETPRKRPGRPPKQDTGSSAIKSVKRVGRPPKRSLEEKLSSFEVEPKFVPFGCEWRDCRAELQNMDTLRKHVRAVHIKEPTSDGYKCSWNLCGSIVPDVFSEESLLLNHVEETHLVPYSWHMGDGPRGSSLASASSASPTYLTDASGRQVTPSVLDPPQRIEAGLASVNNQRRWDAQQNQPDPLLGTGFNLAGLPRSPDLIWYEDRDKGRLEDAGSVNRVRDHKRDKELADSFEVVQERRRRGEIGYTSPDMIGVLIRKAEETYNRGRAALLEAADGTAHGSHTRAPRGRPRGRIASIGRMQLDGSRDSTTSEAHEQRRGRARGRGVVPNRGSRGRPRGRPRGTRV